MAKKVDKNQRAIVQALRQCGYTVLHLHAVGRGCPDLMVGRDGVNYLIEVKSAKGKLTPQQVTFFGHWQGQVMIIRSVEEVMALAMGERANNE